MVQQESDRLGSVHRLRNPYRGRSGLGLAIRLCRDGDRTLLDVLRKVPEEYVGRVSRLADRHEISVVACVCGAPHEVTETLSEHSCGRWLISDDSGAWAAKL